MPNAYSFTAAPSDQAFQHPKFRVLSLDGGGIRGVFGAVFLAELERELDEPIGRYFDLIAGTSTGGIIALALAAGIPAGDISQLYLEQADEIFRARPLSRSQALLSRLLALRWAGAAQLVAGVGFQVSKYSDDGLQDALERVFGEMTMEDLTFSRVVIPAVDLTTASTVVFKTPHLPNLTRDRKLRVADIAKATSSAPTYFPHTTIESGSRYADGGLWANNPTIVAVAEAYRISELCQRDEDPRFEPQDVAVLSIGTGRAPHCGMPGPSDTGLLWWAPRFLNISGLSQSLGYHHLAHYLVGDKYSRIDFDLPDASWQLDNTAVINDIAHFGREAAVRVGARIMSRYLFEVAPSLVPFPTS